MKRNRMCCIGFAVAALLLAAGCGQSKKAGAAAVAFNETGFPIVNEPLTLRALSAKHDMTKEFNELPIFQELEKKTGIHIEWEYTTADWGTQKPLLLASGDLPDIFFARTVLGESDVIQNTGLFVQLDPLIEKYGVNLKKIFANDPGIYGLSKMYDGHIYGLPQKMPNIPVTYATWGINQNWLTKLGLAMPTTTEEFYQVLKAFKTRDPNGNGIADEIPYSIQSYADLCGVFDIFSAFGVVESMNGSWLSVTNGKVEYIPVQAGYTDAVVYLRRLYAEGLIDQEGFTQDWGMWAAKCAPAEGEPEIVGVAGHWSRELAFGDSRVDHYPLLLPLKGPKGDQYWRINPVYAQTAKFCFEIPASNKNPEATFRWADALYDEVVGMQFFYGGIGVTMKDNGNGTYETLPPPPGQDQDSWQWGNALNNLMPGYVSDEFCLNITDAMNAAQLADKRILASYGPDEYFPLVSYTPAEADELSTLATDIRGYAQEQTSRWIVEGGIETEYDAFVRQLESMGLARMVAIYQAAYDRFVGK